MSPGAETSTVVAVIPARNEARRVGETVRAVLGIPAVDHVVVVDDGSDDGTAAVARQAGAAVVAHRRSKGKARAMETGAGAAVATRRTEGGDLDSLVLVFLDADLGASGTGAAALLGPVLADEADLTIGLLAASDEVGGGRGLVVDLARRGIAQRTGWVARQPLSGQRCMTATTFERLRPFAVGFGVEVGMTIDALAQGLRVVEVPTTFGHRVTGRDWRAQLHRGRQYRDVVVALVRRRSLAVRPSRSTP